MRFVSSFCPRSCPAQSYAGVLELDLRFAIREFADAWSCTTLSRPTQYAASLVVRCERFGTRRRYRALSRTPAGDVASQLRKIRVGCGLARGDQDARVEGSPDMEDQTRGRTGSGSMVDFQVRVRRGVRSGRLVCRVCRARDCEPYPLRSRTRRLCTSE